MDKTGILRNSGLLDGDRYILLAVALLLLLGITMVYSASSVIAIERTSDPFFYFKKQFQWILLGLSALLVAQKIDYRYYEKCAYPLFLFALFLLLIVLIPGIGKEVGGGRRWLPIGIGSIAFQPSEFAKIALILFLSSYLARKKEKVISLQFCFLPAIVMIGIVGFLVFKEPDMGNAMLLTATLLSLIYIAGVRAKYILSFCMLCIPFVYFALSHGFRAERIKAFLDPWAYEQGAGFQLIQSFYSFGRGGVDGVGLGQSQQKMLYLPEAHTDFIFSLIGEELGLIGTISIVVLFAVFLVRGMMSASKAETRFGQLLASGITLLISYQALFNIAVTIGLVPTKGLPLPLISAGGSSMIFTLTAIGILLNISKESAQHEGARE